MEREGMGDMAEAVAAFELMNDRAKNESLVYQNHARLRALKNDSAANPDKIAALEYMVERRIPLVQEGKRAESLFKFELGLLLGPEDG